MIKKILKHILHSLLLISLLFMHFNIYADDFVPDMDETALNTFILNSDDSGGDISLQFGKSLSKMIKWNSVDLNFNIQDDLIVDGDLEQNGVNFILDSDNTGAGADIDIIANQGADADGIIRYNSTLNRWEYANDGVTFVAFGAGSALGPYISSVSPGAMYASTSKTISISGGNFDYNTNVSITGWPGTIDDTRYISNSLIEIDVTSAAALAIYSLVLSNGSIDSTGYEADEGLNALEVRAPASWYDLRLGGDAFSDGNAAGNDIRYRSGMSMSRDANGMWFTGSSPWSSWVKFESLQWNRGDSFTLQWVFTRPSSNMMVGIGSDATNETSTAQYAQAEVEAYFSSSTNLWGLYGNNGTIGSAGNHSNSQSISGGTGVYKAVFENDGGLGTQFTLYELPSAAQVDWDNTATVLTQFNIGGSLNPDETNIMPFIIPINGGTQRFVAVKVD